MVKLWKQIQDFVKKTPCKQIGEDPKVLDQTDHLQYFKKLFLTPQRNNHSCIYLCGNSLGLQPKSTRKNIEKELLKWENNAVEGHFYGDTPWVNYHHLSKKILGHLVGGFPEEVVAMNNLTTNLHLGLTTFYRPTGKRKKVLIEKGAFPSDYYAVYSHILLNGGDVKKDIIELESVDQSNYLSTDDIISKIKELDEELALVLFPGIQYYTGQLFDIQAITNATHAVGAIVGFDLAHSIGNVPMQLHLHNVDFAVWCSYKYLNAGPGAVGGFFIHQKHIQNTSLPRLLGWWGNNVTSRFKMENQINPIPTVDGWLLSNPNILSHASLLASLEIFDKAGIHRLRSKSIKLTTFLEESIENNAELSKIIKIISPKSSDERGCQLSFFIKKNGKTIYDKLINNGVILDWREPNVIRVAPVPLYNSYEEVNRFIEILTITIKN